MASSGMLHRVAVVRTDIAEERITSIIRVTRIGELGTTLAVTNNRNTLRRNTSNPAFPMISSYTYDIRDHYHVVQGFGRKIKPFGHGKSLDHSSPPSCVID
jgi:hypothetical protein